MQMRTLTTVILRLDAAVNLLLAAGVLVAARMLADAAGLETVVPLYGFAALLAVNGILCWQATLGVPTPSRLRTLATIDGLFAIVAVVVALVDPTDATVTLRWALAALGVVVGVVAGVKLLLAGQQSRAVVAAG